MSKEQTPNKKLQYTGKSQPPQEGVKDLNQREYFPYLPSEDLIEAVNLAIALERPLLLEGEPGCGKTRLAGAVAYEFTQEEYLQKENKGEHLKCWDYYIWNIKSTIRQSAPVINFTAMMLLLDYGMLN